MRITSIELAGERTRDGKGMPRAIARIGRKLESEYIDVTILMPGGERTHHVQADCDEDVQSMAECLQFNLDGCKGTNGDIHGYYTILQYFAG